MGAESTLGCWSRVGAALKCSFLVAVTSQATLKDVIKYPEKSTLWKNGSTYGGRFLVFLIKEILLFLFGFTDISYFAEPI